MKINDEYYQQAEKYRDKLEVELDRLRYELAISERRAYGHAEHNASLITKNARLRAALQGLYDAVWERLIDCDAVVKASEALKE